MTVRVVETAPLPPEPKYCSLCGKRDGEVTNLIVGPMCLICNECVDLAHDIVHGPEASGIRAKLENMKRAAAGPTAKVRVAVAVDKDGVWSAAGHAEHSASRSEEDAVYEAGDGATVYWLTAGLPIPEAVEIEAEVERG